MSIVLKGITWDHPRGYQPLIAGSAVYEADFGVKVEWHKRSLTAFGDQSLEELCNQFDLLIIDHPHVGLAAARKYLEPLDNIISLDDLSELNAQSAGPSFQSYYYQGRQWALPVDAAMQCAVYRPDMIAKKDIPSNWDQVFKLAEKLKHNDSYLGIAFSPTDCLCSFLSLTAQANSPIREENAELVNIDIGLNVLEQLKKIKNSFHPACLDWTPISLLDYMSSSDDVVYSPLTFCYNNYSRNNFRKEKLIFHDVPGSHNAVLGGAGISVSQFCKNKIIAGKFAAWICSPVIQRTIYADAQGQPGNIVAWTDERVNDITNDFFYNTIKTLENAYVRPRYNGWAEFQTKMGNIIHDFLKYDKDANEVIAELNTLFQKSGINK